MVDTGSKRANTGGLPQYHAYCRHIGIPEDIDKRKKFFCKFGISGKPSIGISRIHIPIVGIILNFFAHNRRRFAYFVVIRIRIHVNWTALAYGTINALTNWFTMNQKKKVGVVCFHGNPFVCWEPLQQSFLTFNELKRLQKWFGHPHADKLYNIIRRPYIKQVDEQTRKALEEISRKCKAFQT